MEGGKTQNKQGGTRGEVHNCEFSNHSSVCGEKKQLTKRGGVKIHSIGGRNKSENVRGDAEERTTSLSTYHAPGEQKASRKGVGHNHSGKGAKTHQKKEWGQRMRISDGNGILYELIGKNNLGKK